ncbi:hypothetical protein ES702_02772 [subsurface metagenome]
MVKNTVPIRVSPPFRKMLKQKALDEEISLTELTERMAKDDSDFFKKKKRRNEKNFLDLF